MNELLTSVTAGKHIGKVVLPYVKLRFGWLCDMGENKQPEVIEEK